MMTPNFIQVPHTTTSWLARVKESGGCKLGRDLINAQPVVAWFSEKRLAILQLIKIPGSTQTCRWMITGKPLFNKEEDSIIVAPRSLASCLSIVEKEKEWIPCEFPHEIAFYNAAIDYHLNHPAT